MLERGTAVGLVDSREKEKVARVVVELEGVPEEVALLLVVGVGETDAPWEVDPEFCASTEQSRERVRNGSRGGGWERMLVGKLVDNRTRNRQVYNAKI